MDFVTLGMFIIDEIHYQPPKESDLEVVGGAGLYASLGARLFRPQAASSRVGWVIHQGYDFPPHVKEMIDTWNTYCRFIQTPNRQTTRAYNKYEPNGYRSFRYLNEKIRVDENSLALEHLLSKTYHLICSPNRCIDLVQGIKARRKKCAGENPTSHEFKGALQNETVFIWEPMPDLCKPAELQKFLDALKYVDVMSPNLDEFCSLLDISIDLEQPVGWTLLRQKCREFVEADGQRLSLL